MRGAPIAKKLPVAGSRPMGVHAIDGMIDLCGPIKQVYCQSFRQAVQIDSDDTTSMLFRMKGGMSGYLGTMTATGPGFSFQVFGTKGWVRLGRYDPRCRSALRRNGARACSERANSSPTKGPAEIWQAAKLDVTRATLESFAKAASGGASVSHSPR